VTTLKPSLAVRQDPRTHGNVWTHSLLIDSDLKLVRDVIQSTGTHTHPVDYPFSITSSQSNGWPVKIAYVWGQIAQMLLKLGATAPGEVSTRFQFQLHKPQTPAADAGKSE
jgi:hypothetical protein